MKPILFNTEMVRGILAGLKTVIRRLIKPQPYNVLYDGELQQGEIEDGDVLLISTEAGKTEMIIPPYQPGDVLYVRETWCKGSLNGGAERYFYRADDNDFHCRWKPSIHMPKEAARIFLQVTDVRVEKPDINKYGRDANPWLWVIEFERISKEEALKNGKENL